MNEDKCIPLSVAKDYVDIYTSAETLWEHDYIRDSEYNRIIHALCRRIIGQMALILQHRSEVEAESKAEE